MLDLSYQKYNGYIFVAVLMEAKLLGSSTEGLFFVKRRYLELTATISSNVDFEELARPRLQLQLAVRN